MNKPGHAGGSRFLRAGLTLCFVGFAWVTLAVDSNGQPPEPKMLHIGTSGSLGGGEGDGKNKSALESLEGFIKSETGMESKIIPQPTWGELAAKLMAGEVHLGVFQGYEFAWAKEKHSELQPLTIAVNVQRYPVIYAVTSRDSSLKSISDLQGKTLSVPAGIQGHTRLFLQQQSGGKKPEEYFGKVGRPDNIEDALDDAVDGVVKATVVDGAALEAFKRRKPGRFGKLKVLGKSEPFPPAVIVSKDKALPEATLMRFREGMLNAGRKERGQTMLTLFRLSGFEAIPADFDKVLEQTRKQYVADAGKTK